MNATLHILVIALLPLLAAPGCTRAADEGPVNRNLPTISMKIGGETFTLEIAANEDTRQTGLMNRKSMPDDHGMIFVFPDEQIMGFWMKNTYIPLDILYVNADKQVVSIHRMQPLDLNRVISAAPAKFAIELNAGAAARAGVRVGDRLDIPASVVTDR